MGCRCSPCRLRRRYRGIGATGGDRWRSITEVFNTTRGLDRRAVHAHATGLADALRARLGMPPAGSAIVAVPREGAAESLVAAGVRASTWAGAARLSFHLYSTEEDLDLAATALGTSTAA